ncbi:MAG: glycosyltransferase [Planctomycetota bacterium]|nr:glycosyltransferase [Planctomycetota bacterium]
MSQTVVVVPCYNEAERFDLSTFRAFVRSCTDVSLLLVNDGSQDRTLDVLEDFSRDHPARVQVLDLPQNVGKSEAVRQGFLTAFERDPTYVGFWDADLATPLDAVFDFRTILNRRPEVLVAIGSRLPLLGHHIERRWTRGVLGRVFGIVASQVLGLRIRDTQCGAKLFRTCDHTRALFTHPFLSRWIFDVELLARLIVAEELQPRLLSSDAIREDQGVYEVVLDSWKDVAGSKVKGRDFVQAAFELARIHWRYFIRDGAAFVAFPDADTVPVSVEHRKAA